MRPRVACAVVVALVFVGLTVGCGTSDDDVPTGPGVSRAEPTGTVNTTVPTTAEPTGDDG
jgi:hypothetical protein